MFSLMNDMDERERERERESGEIKRKAKKLKEKAEEAACSETAIKFSIDYYIVYGIDSICPKISSLSMHLSLRVT